MIILDSSAALRCSLPQVDTAERDAFRAVAGRHECFSPVLFLSEISNAVWKEIRFRDLRQAFASDIILSILDMTTLRIEDVTLVTKALEIAISNEHSVYDCIYIAMSRELKAPILTADKKLRRKFPNDQFVDIENN